MCGIIGLWQGAQRPIDLVAAQEATNCLRHRGPDDEGYLLVNTASRQMIPCAGPTTRPNLGLPPLTSFQGQSFDLFLGFRRLSIIDLSSGGHQPMRSTDGSLWLVFNGEIYNYRELRQELRKRGHVFRSHSDSEVILHAYAEWGEECVEHFNGMWAFVIYDAARNVLFCSRDRMGIKPFYYYFDEKRFLFASEIKALVHCAEVPKRVSQRAVYEYLAHGAVEYSNETFFTHIYKLMQGHNLTLDLNQNQLQLKQYYQPPRKIDYQISLPAAAAEFRRLLVESVGLQLQSDVPVGSCLSGGLDSSSIVCLISDLFGQRDQAVRQHTFSSHFAEAEANELEYMQEVIRTTNVQPHFTYPTHQEFLEDLDQIVWHQEEPFGSTSIFAQWSVFKLVQSKGVKVVLDGQGPDEMMGGYLPLVQEFYKDLLVRKEIYGYLRESWLHNRRYAQPLSTWAPLQLVSRLQRYWTHAIRQVSTHVPNWLSTSMVQTYGSDSQFQANRKLLPFGKEEHFQNVLYQLTFYNNLPTLLKYEDRNSMAFSVEARVPFLDHRLVEFIFTLPAALKIHRGYTKYVLREAMADILPEKIRWRTGKLGFATPEKSWQESVLNTLVKEAIRDEALHLFIDPKNTLAYLETIKSVDSRSSIPWRLINLSRWLKVYNPQICQS